MHFITLTILGWTSNYNSI